jgi:hypothetical protein
MGAAGGVSNQYLTIIAFFVLMLLSAHRTLLSHCINFVIASKQVCKQAAGRESLGLLPDLDHLQHGSHIILTWFHSITSSGISSFIQTTSLCAGRNSVVARQENGSRALVNEFFGEILIQP